jgi:hypothetical protein
MDSLPVTLTGRVKASEKPAGAVQMLILQGLLERNGAGVEPTNAWATCACRFEDQTCLAQRSGLTGLCAPNRALQAALTLRVDRSCRLGRVGF